jgi:hypothetical protein
MWRLWKIASMTFPIIHLMTSFRHPKCATDLALGLIQDTCELATGKPTESECKAVEWLDLYAQKKLEWE